MDKEFLIGLGLDEENADLILEKNNSEISDIKVRNHIERELTKKGVKNINAAMKLFDVEGLKIADNKIENLDEVVDGFIAENDFLFEKNNKPVFSVPTTAQHDLNVSREEFMKMGYAKRLKLYNENPEMYKILTENV